MKHYNNKIHLKTIECSRSHNLNYSKNNFTSNSLFSIKAPTIPINSINKNYQNSLFISAIPNYKNSNKNKKNKIISKSINEVFIKDVKESLKHNKTEIYLFNKKFTQINLSERKKYHIFSQKNINNKSFEKKYKESINLIFDNNSIKNELINKRNIKSASSENTKKRKEIIKNIPLSIKGYQKNMTDIFHSRQIQDSNYQNHYEKQKANIKDILLYHRVNKRNCFKGEKVPSYHYNKFNKSARKINNTKRLKGNKFKNNIFLFNFNKN